ncbi:MAG: hypothetical protein JO345_01895 [Streptosporangiaceae bacterium]|nr:hypothetical protein [Streptosporangiaceae bacterium]
MPSRSSSPGTGTRHLPPMRMTLTANSPRRAPYASMYPILEEAPHYLQWVGAQGFLGTIPPWCAVVAADLSRRVRWRRCASGRGAGRLLWMCEQMATPLHAEKAVPAMWRAATARGVTTPDWVAGGKPTGCHLDDAAGLAAESGHWWYHTMVPP